MNKKNKSAADLFKEVTAYKPTATEAERETKRQEEISAIDSRISELEKEGYALVHGYSRSNVIVGDFPKADQGRKILEEINALRRQRKALSIMPIQDDEYIAICSDLETVASQLTEAEEQYSNALTEYERVKGSVPFDVFKGLETECYSFSEKVQELKTKKEELEKKKANYNRKSDALYMEFEKARDAETVAFMTEKMNECIAFLTGAREQKKTAERITFERRGDDVNDIVVPVPFFGDIERQLLKYCDEILKLVNYGQNV